MQKIYKKRFFTAVALFFALSGALILFSYFGDPCNIYGFRNTYQACSPRYFQAGRIRRHLYENSDFETLSIGSSVSENFLASEIEKYLGWKKTMRLYIPGYYIKELDSALRYALESGKIRKVLWGLDALRYETRDGVYLTGTSFPYELYNTSIWDDFQHLTSFSNLRMFYYGHSEKRIRDKHYPRTGENEDFDFWADSPFSFAFAHNFTSNAPQQPKPPLWNPENREFPYVDAYIVSLAEQYPDVEFYLFFPPYAYVYPNLPLLADVYDDYLDMRSYLVKRTAGRPNVKVFDFLNLEEITGNMAYYRDIGHYQPNINTAMLKLMGQERGRLTPENIDRHVAELSARINAYQPYIDFEATTAGEKTYYTLPAPLVRQSEDGAPVVVRTGKIVYPHAKTMVVKIRADVPNDGLLTVTGEFRNDRGKFIPIPLKKGENTDYFVINMLPAEQELTFSFAAGKGEYTLQAIEIRQMKEDF
jgi:hypothetical protein